MDAFYVIGSVLAAWALLVSFLGITRKGFPASSGAEIAVAAVSLALVAGAIGSAVVGAANDDHGGGDGEDHAATAALSA